MTVEPHQGARENAPTPESSGGTDAFAEALAGGLPDRPALAELTAIGHRFNIPGVLLWKTFDALPAERRAQSWTDVQDRAAWWRVTPSEREPARRGRSVSVPTDTDTVARPVRQLRDHGDDPLRRIPIAEALPALTGRDVDGRGWTCCPFHGDGQERTPSFHATDDRWYCFGCGTGGTIIDLGAELYRLEPRGSGFHEIRRRLAADLLRGLDGEVAA